MALASIVSQADIVLVTVNLTETQAVLSAVRRRYKRTITPEYKTKTYYDLGEIGGVQVCLVRSEAGTSTAGGSQSTAEDAISDLRPGYLIAVGIAFGLKPEKQVIGQVLVSRQLQPYESNRIGTSPKGKVKSNDRNPRVDAPHKILDRFRVGENLPKWAGKLKFGLMLSGEKLVDNLALRNSLVKRYPEAIGGEMEGTGLYAVASKYKIDWLVVKAISDWGDGQKGQDEDAHQKLAAENAVAFVLDVIELGGFREPVTLSTPTMATNPAPDKDTPPEKLYPIPDLMAKSSQILTRLNDLEELISKANTLLSALEKRKLYSSDELEKGRLEYEILHVRERLATYEAEHKALKGNPKKNKNFYYDTTISSFAEQINNSWIFQSLDEARWQKLTENLVCPQLEQQTARFVLLPDIQKSLGDFIKSEKIILVQGMPGIGKTSLIKNFAWYHQSAETDPYFKGVFFLQLKPEIADLITALNELASMVIRDFSPPQYTSDKEYTQNIIKLIEKSLTDKCDDCADGRFLLVIDNVNSDLTLNLAIRLIEVCKFISVFILITNLMEIYVKVKLANKFLKLRALNEEEGLELFKNHLGSADGSEKDLRELVHILGGHPLAIELAARYLQVYSFAIKDLINHYESIMRAGLAFTKIKGLEKLEVSLYVSYEALSSENQIHFQALAILPAYAIFDDKILAAIWTVSAQQARMIAADLHACGLLEKSTESNNNLWQQNPLIRSYALVKLKSSEQVRNYYYAFILEIARKIDALPEQDWQQLNFYFPHLQAVGDRLATEMEKPNARTDFYEFVLNFAYSTNKFVFFRAFRSGQKWLKMGLLASQQLGDKEKELFFLRELANFHFMYTVMQGDNDSEKYYEKYYNEVQTMLNSSSVTPTDQAQIMLGLGIVHSRRGELDQALQFYLKAQNLNQNDPDFYAIILINKAEALFQKKEYPETINALNEATKLLEKSDNKRGLFYGYFNKASVYIELERWAEALVPAQQALALYNEIEMDDVDFKLRIYRYLVNISYQNQKLDLAIGYARQGLEFSRATDRDALKFQEILTRLEQEKDDKQ